MQSGPSPIFKVTYVDGVYKFGGLKGLKFDVPTIISRYILPTPEIMAVLQSPHLQERINRHLRVIPISMEGIVDLNVPSPTGRPIILKDVPWKIKINEITGIQMRPDNLLEITSFGYDDYSFHHEGLRIPTK